MADENSNLVLQMPLSTIEYALAVVQEFQEKYCALALAVEDGLSDRDGSDKPTEGVDYRTWWLMKLLKERCESTDLENCLRQIFLAGRDPEQLKKANGL